MARRKKGQAITGLVIVDKPSGVTSNHVLQSVKRLFNAQKAGHTGTLDPLASGVLPICLGEATKLSTYLLDADKQYEVTCKLGLATDTGDSQGQIIDRRPVPNFDLARLTQIVTQFIGIQQQIPPMFSALKHQGQPLYKLAREGITIKRESRQITIYNLQIGEFDATQFSLRVDCSKGTYIRTLVQDIAAELGSCGHVTYLRRTKAAGFTLADSVALPELAASEKEVVRNQYLKPALSALPEWPVLKLTEQQTNQLYFGQPVQLAQETSSESLRLLDAAQNFIGLGRCDETGLLTVKRLFVRDIDAGALADQTESR
ncbi:tRNA pseudouridine synthase B [Methylophaga frappieri]|uniref:tRNA pseudouridine synthase B n=1 Tax=Methylophaga frappieri (strain ATCC BAA-2434 / DSM 25690 / JAM7) TaxID=754477 RepID=I1YFQ4_METFJ|nr:tRNA pseudouridine(55) synthase TruB [Methylophaga frappieri]AFJ01747.1 tRNA pseudouridine synthase B [Methylophaga frappieri]